jgi:lipopolysaccharide transport system ATP-binding protein
MVISARKLGKKYLLGQRADAYLSLRDVVMRGIQSGLSRVTRAEHRSRPDFWALRDVNLDVAQGSVLGIIGRNGAGKSTLLKILSRVTVPTEGRVTIRGRLASLLEVGTGFHSELTGRENILLNGVILGMTRREVRSRFDEIVEFAGVEPFLDTPVKTYSSGMYVRLAFAVAAHLDPQILLVDEVLAVGDAQFQKKCVAKLNEIGKEGRTVLFVSHNMNAIERLCTSALLLENGRVKDLTTDVRGCIREYLFGDDERPVGLEWRRSSDTLDNPWFSPTRFYVADREGIALRDVVANDEDCWVHIEWNAQQLDAALTIGYAIFSSDDLLLYWSYHTDTPEDSWPAVQPGFNHFRSRIPSRFFNEGMYRIEMIGSLHYREWLLEPGVSAPAVFLTIQGGLSDSPYWMVKRPGLLAPELPWDRVAG